MTGHPPLTAVLAGAAAGERSVESLDESPVEIQEGVTG